MTHSNIKTLLGYTALTLLVSTSLSHTSFAAAHDDADQQAHAAQVRQAEQTVAESLKGLTAVISTLKKATNRHREDIKNGLETNPQASGRAIVTGNIEASKWGTLVKAINTAAESLSPEEQMRIKSEIEAYQQQVTALNLPGAEGLTHASFFELLKPPYRW